MQASYFVWYFDDTMKTILQKKILNEFYLFIWNSVFLSHWILELVVKLQSDIFSNFSYEFCVCFFRYFICISNKISCILLLKTFLISLSYEFELIFLFSHFVLSNFDIHWAFRVRRYAQWFHSFFFYKN